MISLQYSSIEERKKLLKDVKKQKEDILLLKKKPYNKNSIYWPRSVKSNSSFKSDKKRSKKFIARPLDPFTFVSSEQNITDKTESEAPEESQHNVNEFIEHFLSQQLKPKPKDTINESTVNLIQEKSLDLLDKAFINMISSGKLDENTNLDWEFILGNMLQLNIPPSVLDRVKRKMALLTGKDTPAITAMNVAPTLLSDLTITNAEVQMNQEIDNLVKKNDKLEFIAGDEEFESPVKWILDFEKKNLNSQTEVMEKIHHEYTKKVLDLKPAFF